MDGLTNEQASLLMRIVSQLDRNAVTGEWPHQQCQHCSGESDGYPHDETFTDNDDCVVLLIEALQQTTYASRGEI